MPSHANGFSRPRISVLIEPLIIQGDPSIDRFFRIRQRPPQRLRGEPARGRRVPQAPAMCDPSVSPRAAPVCPHPAKGIELLGGRTRTRTLDPLIKSPRLEPLESTSCSTLDPQNLRSEHSADQYDTGRVGRQCVSSPEPDPPPGIETPGRAPGRSNSTSKEDRREATPAEPRGQESCVTPLNPDLDEAQRSLRALDPEAEVFTFQWFDDGPAKEKGKAGHQTLPPDDLKRLVETNRDRCGVFVTVNETDGRGRKAHNVTRVRAVFVDLDGADPQSVKECALTPHIIVESSAGRFHAYWRTDDVPLDRFKDLQQRIAIKFSGDKAVNDLPRVMRVPGFWHQKGRPFRTRIHEINPGAPYTLEQIEEHVCAPAELKGALPPGVDPEFRGEDGDLDWKEIIAGLNGERPGEWHAAMIKAVASLVARGASDSVILAFIMPYWATPRSKPYTKAAVRKEVEDAIKGARTKWGAPWRKNLIVNQKGAPLALLSNAITALRGAPELIGLTAYNLFTNTIDLTRPPPWRPESNGAWRDQDDVAAADHLSRAHGIHVRPNVVREAVTVVAEDRTHHPVRDQLKGLKWDKTPRLDTWAIRHLGAPDTPYTRAVSSRFLISAVARVWEPGCKADAMLILEGEQDLYKSTALRILAGDAFLDHLPNLDNKDSQLALSGKWIVEVAEMDAMTRAESSKAKEYLSRCEDQFRPPYGRTTVKIPRQCVFAGTVNGDAYLKDDTGGRRFWPVRCTKVADLKALRAERDQLWTEAVARYKRGERWWIDRRAEPELRRQACEEQEGRRQQDPWEERIVDILEGVTETTSSALLRRLGVDTDKQNRGSAMRVSAVLKLLGWKQFRTFKEGRRYFAPGYGPEGMTTSHDNHDNLAGEGCHEKDQQFQRHDNHDNHDNLSRMNGKERERGRLATEMKSLKVGKEVDMVDMVVMDDVTTCNKKKKPCRPTMTTYRMRSSCRNFLMQLSRIPGLPPRAVATSVVQLTALSPDQLSEFQGRFEFALDATDDAAFALRDTLEWLNGGR